MRSGTRQQLLDNIPAPRLQTYLTAAGQDPELALDLYQWNIDAAAAVSGTLAIVEVALRDTIDQRLREWNVLKGGSEEWITAPQDPPLSHLVRRTPPAKWQKDPRRRPGDLHGHWWEAMARGGMKDHLGRRTNPSPTHDDLVAALTFGTWKNLLPKPVSLKGQSRGPHVDLWKEALNVRSSVCTPGHGFNASSGTAYYWCSLLVYARNRASHLEPLLDTSELRTWHRTAGRMVASLWPGAEVLITGPARIPNVIRRKPSRQKDAEIL